MRCQGDIEGCILRTLAVIGQVDVLSEESVQVSRLSLAGSTSRVQQHAAHDVVGALAVLANLAEILFQVGEKIVHVFRNGSRKQVFLLCQLICQLAQQISRELGEVDDEIEGVLHLVGDSGS